MSHHNKEFDKKIRDLETTMLPDLSHIDQHWKAISSKPVRHIKFHRLFVWVAAIVVIGVFLLVIKNYFNNPEKDTSLLSKGESIDKKESDIVIDVTPNGLVSDLADTLPRKRSAKATTKTKKYRAVPTKTQKRLYKTPKKTTLLRARTSAGVDTLIEAIKVDADTNDIINSSIQMQDFFEQLANQPQSFRINNLADTILVGKAGSMLSIPAMSFGNKKEITIVLTEYYTKEEFIRNRLVTMAGTQQLVSGGMVKISAFEDGRELSLAPGKKISWHVANKGNDLSNMLLFEGKENKPQLTDTIRVIEEFTNYASVDWLAREQRFTLNEKSTQYRVLDLRNTPYKTKSTRKGEVGYFVTDPNPGITKTELKKSLASKYDYKKVVVRTNPRRPVPVLGTLFFDGNRWTAEPIGDSTWVDSSKLSEFGLVTVATKRTQAIINIGAVTRVSLGMMPNMPALQSQLNDKYGVELNKLGWINCDRFYRDPRPKSPLYVEIQDSITNYYTTLIFKNLNACLSGMTLNKSTVLFDNIPEGEELILVCVGTKQGKIWSTLRSFVKGEEKLLLTGFTETTPTSFKEKLTILDK